VPLASALFAQALLHLDLGRPAAALSALLRVPPPDRVPTLVTYGHLLVPALLPPTSTAADTPAVGDAPSLGHLLRAWAPSLLAHVLAQAGGRIPLEAGLRLLTGPVDATLPAQPPPELGAVQEDGPAPAPAALLRLYLERCGQGRRWVDGCRVGLPNRWCRTW
jgi:hypothetical protein